MPGIRSGAIGAGAWLAGLPWRLKPGRGKPLAADDLHLKRVVIIKPCCFGDVLMATPALAALRKALPASHIALAVGQWSRPAITNNPRIDELLDAGDGGKEASKNLTRLLKAGKYGTALVLDRSPLLNVMAYKAGIPVRAGLDSGNRGVALTHPVPCPAEERRHEVEWYLDVVRALGLKADSDISYLEFYPTEGERKEAGRLLSEASDESDSGFVAIHLGEGRTPA